MSENWLADYLMGKYLALFEQTGNPLYCWKAYEAARNLRVPVPDECLEYLDTVALEINRLSVSPPEPKNRPIAIAAAMGLAKKGRGGGGPYEEYRKRHDRREVALYFHEALRKHNGSETAAIYDTENKFIESETYIKKALVEYRQYWEAAVQLYHDNDIVVFDEDGNTEVFMYGTNEVILHPTLFSHFPLNVRVKDFYMSGAQCTP